MNLLDQLSALPGADRPGGDDAAICSRRGCRAAAAWRLLWNNPRIHTPERRKTWLACEEHRDWLEQYLRERTLWRETLPLGGAGAAGPKGDA